MKKQYKSLEVKVISLSKTDLITTSAPSKGTATLQNSLFDDYFDLGDFGTQEF